MCNWQYALTPFAPLTGLIMGANKQNSTKKKLGESMARSQALQDQLNKKTTELSTALDSEEPVNTTDRVLDPNTKKKQTIKSLNIPLNTSDSTGTGLNV